MLTVKRIYLSFLLLLSFAGAAAAQDALRTLAGRIEGGTVSFDYSFITKNSDTPFSGNGRAFVSGVCYRIEGSGLDIRCDGSVRWTADPEAGEMVIESSEGETLDFLSNPALLLSDIYGNFDISAVSENGDTSVYTLTPKEEPSIDGLELTLTGGVPSQARLLMKNGAVIEFKVSGFVFDEVASSWSFSDVELAAYQNVTDLR